MRYSGLSWLGKTFYHAFKALPELEEAAADASRVLYFEDAEASPPQPVPSDWILKDSKEYLQ